MMVQILIFVLFSGLNYHHPETTTKIIKHILTTPLVSSLRSRINPKWVMSGNFCIVTAWSMCCAWWIRSQSCVSLI